ncbi:hypothetical protein A2U01_0004197 [Trifolium medium]|uniref:Uncharacterized protein n=1 Tax=Trifolium medium TaxID=97028 RepID=A0A392M9A6_9FABA|nr:hypothetical protein [Trifolium medium]
MMVFLVAAAAKPKLMPWCYLEMWLFGHGIFIIVLSILLMVLQKGHQFIFIIVLPVIIVLIMLSMEFLPPFVLLMVFNAFNTTPFHSVKVAILRKVVIIYFGLQHDRRLVREALQKMKGKIHEIAGVVYWSPISSRVLQVYF